MQSSQVADSSIDNSKLYSNPPNRNASPQKLNSDYFPNNEYTSVSEYSEFSDSESDDQDMVLARIELANAMLDLDPKAVVIQNNKLKANKSTLRSLAGTPKNSPAPEKKPNSSKFSSLQSLPNSKTKYSNSLAINNSNNTLLDDKETILTISHASDSDNDKDLDYIPESNMSKHSKNFKIARNAPRTDFSKSSDHEKESSDANISESSNKLGPYASSNLNNDDNDLSDEDYGENKAPDFILSAKLMQDIDNIANSWESNLLEEPEGAFWGAVINDVNSIKRTTPHLVSAKIRNGIPPKLRGVVWQGLSHGRSTYLQTMYYQLVKEHSPHERIILRDLPRTFPCIEVFKDVNGDGQKRLFNILKAYSLYDAEVGYCQGLGFVIGPLMMNMGECEAFCVLVRLMETYDLRGMFTEDMDGLHLRLYQFSTLAAEILPQLWNHLMDHNIYPAMYAASWFLSLFAYALPLGFVLRVMDVVFCEGAAETIIRVGITLLSRNSKRLMAKNDFESMISILSSGLYRSNSPDDQPLVVLNEANLLSNVVTTSRLNELSEIYYEKICKIKKPIPNSTMPIVPSSSHGSGQSQPGSSSLPAGRAKANNKIMNFFNLSWMNSNENIPRKDSVSSETKLRARQWLSDMQRQQSSNSPDLEPDLVTGFDLLTLSGFEATQDHESSTIAHRRPESRASIRSKLEKSPSATSSTKNLKLSNSPVKDSVLDTNELGDYISTETYSSLNSSNEFIESNSFQHPMNSSNSMNKQNEDIVEPLRRQLHDARVTADTNLHALASLRAEHELILAELARVKLDRAELESCIDEMQRSVKLVEIDKRQLYEQLESTNANLDSTETVLIKSRLKLADSEDMCFALKGMMETASEYIEKKMNPVDKKILLKLLDTSTVFNQNTVNSQIFDAIGTNLSGANSQSNLETLNSSYARKSGTYSPFSSNSGSDLSASRFSSQDPRSSKPDLGLGNFFKIHSSESSPKPPELMKKKRNTFNIPLSNYAINNSNISRSNSIKSNSPRSVGKLDMRKLSAANIDLGSKKKTNLP
ncbi:GTPase-activating protein GYP5 [Smittium culicis]|uniref:GTPase-activating protein GYP5 n=1 Tax=Smittium culicis TaxID=133412 RepID=A0A1R1YSD7_9FUNG|nr:GTPase-activating protein GYP5 [Smittium culicis]